MAEVENITERTHPLYSDYIEEWKFLLESASGGKDYCKNRDNLFTHRLEGKAGDYDSRLSRVYYLNYCRVVCNMYADYIFKEVISRPADSKLTDFRNNVDGRGTDIDTFMNKLSYMSSVFGHMHVLVDSPSFERSRKVPLHVYRNDKTRFDPYLIMVPPTELRDWSLDEFGNPLWVLIRFKDYEDDNPFLDRKDATTYHLITRDAWYVFDKDGKQIRTGINKLGRVYLTTCYNRDSDADMIGESLITDVARINRIIYNWCSNLDEMIERQTFSQLIVPTDEQEDLEKDNEQDKDPLRLIGTSQVFTFPANAGQPPQFISPDVSQIDVIWKMVQEHILKIYELAGLGTMGAASRFLSQRSGKSQGYQFLEINSSLAKKASYLEKTENDINSLIYAWKKDSGVPERVEYPVQFDVMSLLESMDMTFGIVSQNISKTLNIALLKVLAKKVAPALSSDDLNKIYDEIVANEGQIKFPYVAGGGTISPGTAPSSDENKSNGDNKNKNEE